MFHLQGFSQEEIAALLNSKPATIATRLRRAREILSSRLARRGVSVAVGGLLAMLTTQAGAASPSAAFVTSTTQAATLLSAGNLTAAAAASAPPVALAKGAMSMLALAKIQTAAIVATTAAVVATTTVVVVHSSQAEPEEAVPEVKKLPANEMPVRVLWSLDQVVGRTNAHDFGQLRSWPLATVCTSPNVDELTVDHFIEKNKLRLQAAAPGKESAALLISPIS